MANQLKSLTVANFGPFANETTFSTMADSTKKELLDDNTFTIGDNKYNRVSYIYGFNGAGKSNFCRAILQVQSIILISPLIASPNSQLLEHPYLRNYNLLYQNCFKLDKTYEDKPTLFRLEIVLDDVIYAYSFKLKDNKVVYELLTRKHRRTETIMERTSPRFEDIVVRSEFKSFENYIKVVKENVLCLSMAAFLNNPLASALKDAIQSIKVVNMATLFNLSSIEEKMLSEDKLKKYLGILKLADPTLSDIKVAYSEKKVEQQRLNIPDFENREIVIKNIEVDVTSTHNMLNEFNQIVPLEMPFLQIESNGTIKLLGILPFVFNAIEQGDVVIIDEIENGLHSTLVKILIDLFKKSDHNIKNAQLICTTHSVDLIQKDTRRDQVWIIEKAENGMSKLCRVSDIPGMRAYENNGEKYLEKAFGSIPHAIFS